MGVSTDCSQCTGNLILSVVLILTLLEDTTDNSEVQFSDLELVYISHNIKNLERNDHLRILRYIFLLGRLENTLKKHEIHFRVNTTEWDGLEFELNMLALVYATYYLPPHLSLLENLSWLGVHKI